MSPDKNIVNIENENNFKIPFFKRFTKVQKLKNEIESLNKKITILYDFIERLKYKVQQLSTANKQLIAEKVNLENQLKNIQELQRKKDEAFAIFIHDVKNPAAAIKSFAELLQSYDLSINEQKEMINHLVEASEKIISYSTSISKAIVYESYGYKLDISEVNINEILIRAYNNNISKAQKKKQKLNINLSNNLPKIMGDAVKLEEAFDNLIDNAIKYTKPEKEITISSEKGEKNRIIVKIADQGVGMSYIDIQKAFQKGVKLSARPTGDEPSTGLGLWIVKKIIDDHKGLIKIESELGKGTTFIIFLQETPSFE
ncbi:MAG TPA: HAMP domain-containing sensor histidine kinase [Ignavibacteriales bacterium]|nr:HAMP domain-containing sensor histidine kinase [Ignavibacteriales bacterium]HOL81159.1 HAMP domain-containing sensor histidine kinase [Ignavibacteriales bacterium]HOM65262.1 HAMP domain-containing sensor histidine kinase [Ignavibacteriales bacterium]HPD66554.1 HAMP domain-containing sensor histidine kinase [Ignavibacteriales bacterium]HPP33485.1 HAMP domain-containing sensor histidine kinase [Ignavibacteriales bacterium]